jgi:dolichol-phosphate mannosyltransferase
MEKTDILVSVVAILHNEAALLAAFLEQLYLVLDSHYTNFEILLVDNGSSDSTAKTVRLLLDRWKCVRYLRLSRRTDEEIALAAGLDAAIGDYVVTLHADFDPPGELIPMVSLCMAGNDLVLGVDRVPQKPGLLYRALRQSFVALARRLIELDLVTGTTGYRALSRQAVNALVKIRQRRRYFAFLTTDIGLTTSIHPYRRMSRSGEQPRHSLSRALRIGLSVLVHNSITPLRMVSVVSICGGLLSLVYSLYVVGVYLLKPDVMPGWTTLSLQVSGMFTLVFLMLGLVGEYLGRLLEETSDRPLYHMRDEQTSSIMLSDLTRRNVLEQSDAPQWASHGRNP